MMTVELLTVSRCRVDVIFVEGLSTEQIVGEICALTNPQVILWYIGPFGLRRKGTEFYKDFLISPIFSRNRTTIFWLVDLTAWAALKRVQCSIDKSNGCCDKIEELSKKRIRCIKSSEIFKKMQAIRDKESLDYFAYALMRNFISASSKNFPNTNISLCKVFSNNCPIMTNWFEDDAGKSYSILQYLEGCLLVDEVFVEYTNMTNHKHLELVFALPNDELKYYRDSESSFQQDVKFLIEKRCIENDITDVHVKIKFLAFNYSSQKEHRPYNAPGEVLKASNLQHDDIFGVQI
jgi:hypothetical protein